MADTLDILQRRSQEILARPEAARLLLLALGTGAISSVAAAYLVAHIDPEADVKREIWTGVALGTGATLAGLMVKLYTIEQTRRA